MDSETSPLLPGSGSPPPPGSPRTTHDHDHDAQRRTGSQDAKLYPYAVILVGLFSLVADMGGSMVDTPDVRMLEMAVCRDYYRSHNATVIGPPPQSYVPEKLCKVPQIQNNLAYLRAIRSLLMTIPGLLLTLPYGRLADRIGRKPVMLLGMTGQVLNYFWVLFICRHHMRPDTINPEANLLSCRLFPRDFAHTCRSYIPNVSGHWRRRSCVERHGECTRGGRLSPGNEVCSSYTTVGPCGLTGKTELPSSISSAQLSC